VRLDPGRKNDREINLNSSSDFISEHKKKQFEFPAFFA
jgi:hypothetical protein